MSSAFGDEGLLPEVNAVDDLKLLWLFCGNQDGLIHISQRVHRYLKENNRKHVWHVTQYGHDAQQWKEDLYYFLQHVFKDETTSEKNGSN